MSMQPHEDWQTPQPWASRADDGRLYGQPFDASTPNPKQQPPPADWDKGTWTHHATAQPSRGNAQTWLLVGIVAVVIAIAVVAVLMFL